MPEHNVVYLYGPPEEGFSQDPLVLELRSLSSPVVVVFDFSPENIARLNRECPPPTWSA